VLAGHAYGGAVIAAADDERVKALVYIAGLAPTEGETVAQVFYRDERHPQAPQLAPDSDGLIWMPEEGFGRTSPSPRSFARMEAVPRLPSPNTWTRSITRGAPSTGPPLW